MNENQVVLNLEEKTDGEINIVSIKGCLDSSSFPLFAKCLSSHIKAGDAKIVVDMQELIYISAAGVGVLMGNLREARGKGGDIKLCRMPPKIRNFFDMIGFSRLFKIYDTREKAIKAFSTEEKQA